MLYGKSAGGVEAWLKTNGSRGIFGYLRLLAFRFEVGRFLGWRWAFCVRSTRLPIFSEQSYNYTIANSLVTTKIIVNLAKIIQKIDSNIEV